MDTVHINCDPPIQIIQGWTLIYLDKIQQMENTPSNIILECDKGLSARFGSTGQRPQNFIKNVDPSERYNKYPKAQQLMQEKKQWIQQRNHPPVYIKQNLKTFDMTALGKFDAIYCDPPWQQYKTMAKKLNLYDKNHAYYDSWTLEELKNLKVDQIADTPSFIFLWVGSDHLDDGRELFKKWGFKRCEDIVWIKTNKEIRKIPSQSDQGILVRVKEHCLVGFKGEAKKASDHTFIHPNIDIDVVVTEQPTIGRLDKPPEVYDIIERFCLGRKKIELFGGKQNIRNGWLTIGNQLTQSKFSNEQYTSWFEEHQRDNQNTNNSHYIQYKGYKGGRRMGSTPVIESLRPKQEQKGDDDAKKSISSNK